MKIMFCASCLSYGGAEKNLCIVANHIASKGNDVVICNFNTAPTVQKLNEHIRVIDMPRYTKKGIKRLQQLNFVRKVMKKEKPDVAISFLAYPNFFSAIAGKLTGTSVIVSERGDPYRITNKIEKWMYSKYPLAAGAVFQTEMARDYFPESLRKKSVVIANPVVLKDDTIFADYDNAEKTIAYSARFEVVQKRQDLMLDAFRLVLEKHPEYVLKFLGDGPDEPRMKEYAKALGIEESVRFCGMSKQVLKDISSSELFVLSSDYEGIPNALLEAMSIGLPCVSTDCSPGGARMLIQDGENGLLVPRGDAEALAAAICRMIEDRNFAIRCGKEATKVRERFSMDSILSAWETYIEKIAAERRMK